MAIEKNKTYLVLNYGTSPVAVSTKHDSYMIGGASEGSPGTLPLDIDEISVINSKSPVFKAGVLRFEEDFQEDIYKELRIPNWRDILTDGQISDILLHPTAESLQRLVDSETDAFFERVRGIYMGLKNSGESVSVKVDEVIEERRREFAAKRRRTAIRITPIASRQDAPEDDTRVAELERELAEMKELLKKLAGSGSGSGKSSRSRKSGAELETGAAADANAG